jgi:hypothetical protein
MRVGLVLALVSAIAIAGTGTGSAQTCSGDCDGNGVVSIDELVKAVGIALGTRPIGDCSAADADGSGTITIDELTAAVKLGLEGCGPAPGPRLNQFQVLGTHNSYHLQAVPPLFDLIYDFSPAIAMTLEYSHLPLDEQLETEGIRQVELDVFADPDGGLYASPYGLREITGDPAATIPELEAPGFKVLHVQDIDYNTNCQTFVECLQTIKSWSDAHPDHMPIMILVEAKDDVIPNIPGVVEFVVPIPIGATELDGIDAEILSVFPENRIITPDDVRGDRATLEEAVRMDGWPTVDESRGKVLFTLDNGGSIKAAYIEGHASLAGRIMFTSSLPGEPEAAFVKLNDPIGDFDMIREVVSEGFVVRTRADADTVQARNGDTTMRDMALASGAQWVSTDYPVPDPDFGTGYRVAIPGGRPARCNPISAPPGCRPEESEDLGAPAP